MHGRLILNTAFHIVLREKRGGGALLTEKETEREQRQVMLMEESVRERDRQRAVKTVCKRRKEEQMETMLT